MPRYLRLRNLRYNRVFLLIGVGALIFISFQLLSLRALSKSAKEMSRDNFDVIDDDDDDDDQNIDDISLYKKEEKSHEDRESPKSLKSSLPVIRGVNPDEADLYVANDNQMFTCLHSKKLIPFSDVNDDYCDCDDNTDEPGTSACDGKFYCKTQFPNQALVVLPSNRVNDGICDCCDGSDEWKKIGPPEGINHADRSKLSIKYAPCEDKCKQILQTNKEEEKIRTMGKRLKVSYINAARNLPQKENYGPEGVFYKLSRVCYPHKHGEYEYQVCPFKKVTQEHFPSRAFNLGKVAEWIHKKNGRYVLRMDEGDSHLCPDGLFRMSLITFLCGLNDRVISLQEDDKCVYGIKFATPAAC